MRYLFRHVLMRDAVYGLQLRSHLRQMHLRAAQAIKELYAPDLSDQYIDLAHHYEQAGQTEQAASYLRQAGERALNTGAYRKALGISRRALALTPEGSLEWANILVWIGQALIFLCDYEAARGQLEMALAVVQPAGELGICARALYFLGMMALDRGDMAQARAYYERSLALAREVGDRAMVSRTLWGLGWVDIRQGAYGEAEARLTESQAICQVMGDRQGLAGALGGLSVVANQGFKNYERAWSLNLQALALAQEIGDRGREAILLVNLGEDARGFKEYTEAQHYYRRAIELGQDLGDKLNVMIATNNLGHVAAALRDDGAAQAYYLKSLRMTNEIGIFPITLESLVGLAGVLARTGKPEQAVGLLGVAARHPSLYDEARPLIEQVLADLHARLSPKQIEAGLERGKALELEKVVQEILAEQE